MAHLDKGDVNFDQNKTFQRFMRSCWIMFSIVLLVSAIMSLAVAFIALLLPGVNMHILAFLLSGIFLGIIGKASLKRATQGDSETFIRL